MLPKIAILGRPNVGKSSLLNRLAGRRISIVDPTPGTTRDRIVATVELAPGVYADLVDTGGWGVYAAEGKTIDDAGRNLASLTPEIEAQILTAAREAAVILFVLDARTGALPLDDRIAKLLRRERLVERVLPIANKVDDSALESEIPPLAKLGFGLPLGVSAKARRGIALLRSRLAKAVAPTRTGPDAPDSVTRAELDAARRRVRESSRSRGRARAVEDAPALDDREAPENDDAGAAGESGENAPSAESAAAHELKVAIVGRRNAGKSSLVNALAGEPRVIVSEIAGTTRDAVDVRFDFDGRALIAIDTAGMRKRKSWDGDIEYYANLRTQDSIARADVCILLLDAVEKISQVEKNLAMQLVEAYKPTIIAVNKWDLVTKSLKPGDYEEYLGKELPGLDFAPMVFVSAESRQGLRDLVAMCFNLFEQASHRETTGRVNAAIARILAERGPSSKLGTKAKVFYVTQVDVRPPTLAIVVNKPDLFGGNYGRYLENKLRDELPFSEVPIKLIFSARKREEWGAADAARAPARDDRAGGSRAPARGASSRGASSRGASSRGAPSPGTPARGAATRRAPAKSKRGGR